MSEVPPYTSTREVDSHPGNTLKMVHHPARGFGPTWDHARLSKICAMNRPLLEGKNQSYVKLTRLDHGVDLGHGLASILGSTGVLRS